MDIHGTCDPAFEPVRKAFAANFDAGHEVGASVAVTHNGKFVVDCWAGLAVKGGRPWERDTIVNVYSSTKTMAALCVLMLADRGKIDLDAPVATYWPEFAQNGKAGVLVKHVMSHSAGLPAFDPGLEVADLYDWKKCCDNLAAQSPWWEPGTESGYHAVTQGYLQGELVRRVDGRTLGNFFREEVAEPLGADFHIGLDAKHDARVAELIPPEHLPEETYEAGTPVARRMAALGPHLDATEPRTREWRAAEIPAAGGTGNARSMGRVHSVLACGGELDGVRLLSEKTLARIMEVQVTRHRPGPRHSAHVRHGLRPPGRAAAAAEQAHLLLGRLGRLDRPHRPRRPHDGHLRHEPHVPGADRRPARRQHHHLRLRGPRDRRRRIARDRLTVAGAPLRNPQTQPRCKRVASGVPCADGRRPHIRRSRIT